MRVILTGEYRAGKEGAMFQALRVRDFRLLWAGGLVSSLGSWLLVVAVPAHILLATGSLRDTGLSLAAEYLPQLVLGPVAGVLADRSDRRHLMIAASVFCAAAVALMLAGTTPVIYAALAAENAGTVLYAPAAQARTPAIVGTGPLLTSASSLNSLSSGTVRLIGGPLGGILLALCGFRVLVAVDSVSYLVAAAAAFGTSRADGEGTPGQRAPGDGTPREASPLRDLIDGARVLKDDPAARALFPVTVIFLAANASLSALLIPLGIEHLGGDAHAGFLLSFLGVGFLLGAPLIRALIDRCQPRILLAATLDVTAAGFFLLFTSSSLRVALPAALVIGIAGSMSLAIPQVTLQRVIHGTALGRVTALFLTGEAAATLAGAVAGPFIAQAAGLAAVAAAASVLTLGASALTWATVPRPETRAVRVRRE
jgi:predicted MFS family arabinose efflux permease